MSQETQEPASTQLGTHDPQYDSPTTFVLEIGTEELPAGDLGDSLTQLRQAVPACLDENRLDYDSLRVLGTPRRLGLVVEGLAPRQGAVEESVKGPPAQIAFDAGGRPTRAAEGFARGQGMSVSDLKVREMDGGKYVVAVRREEGQPAFSVLPNLLIDLIAGLRFRQSMRWNETGVAFSRPIRWLVALLGDVVVPFEYAGVSSGRTSRGPRSEGSCPFEIPHADEYSTLLDQHRIMADPDERRAFIAEQAQELAQGVGGHIPDDPELLDEVTHLVEHPTPFLGKFEDDYLSIPAPVLVAVMKKHQRTFPLLDDRGKMLPYFVAVRNGGSEHLDIVRHGNEEVIRARFADAEYFYAEDTQQPLEGFLQRLDTLTFQEELGSVLDKVYRLEKLVQQIAPRLCLSPVEREAALRAAHLSKADLATQMVVEHTSLQGVMGHQYALESGEPPEVAQAISEHYLPRSADDRLPRSKAGLAVGLADRLDSLAGLFAVGLAPTGSADPYGLRRDALGLVQSLLAHEAPFSVETGLQEAGKLLPVEVSGEALSQALDFVIERLRGYLRDQGHRYDIVDAVLAARGDDPYRAHKSVQQLSQWVERDDWDTILDNYSRCVRITRSYQEQFKLDPTLFVEPAEQELYEAYRAARLKVTPKSPVSDLLTAFLPLVDVIDRYFARESGVLVMAEDIAVRENRLAQLQHIASLADGIVDLSRLEGF